MMSRDFVLYHFFAWPKYGGSTVVETKILMHELDSSENIWQLVDSEFATLLFMRMAFVRQGDEIMQF